MINLYVTTSIYRIPLEAVVAEENIPPIPYDVVKDGKKCGEIKVGLKFINHNG